MLLKLSQLHVVAFTKFAKKSEKTTVTLSILSRAVESEVPSSDSDSWQFRLSDSNSDSGPTFSCISYL